MIGSRRSVRLHSNLLQGNYCKFCSASLPRKMSLPAAFLLATLMLATPSSGSSSSSADIVIVGGGTAGSVLAARLCSSLPRARITLLERSPPRNADAEFLVRSPRNAWEAWESSLVSETFPSEPNPGLGGRTVSVVTGNTLGGSSAINGLQWTVPLRGTIENWRIAGLNTQVAQRFFSRAFRMIHPAPQDAPFKQIYSGSAVDAAAKAGFPETDRPHTGRSRDEVWESFVAIDVNGHRVDAGSAYLQPVLGGKCNRNLRVIEGATVTKLIIRGKGRKQRVVGVQYVSTTDKSSRKKRVIFAKQEVILSAGPYGSPKLLQLSGIGPRDVLNAAGVRVKLDLGVGNKTQGRPLSPFLSAYSKVSIEPSNDLALIKDPVSREKFEAGDSGVFGTSIGATNGRLNTDAYFTSTTTFGDGQGLGQPLFGSFCFGNADSVGHIRIKDKDPFSAPDVQLNLLGEEVDVERILRCVRRMRDIHEELPSSFGLNEVSPADDSRLNEQFVRKSTVYAFHFVGGCAVGPVVQDNLLVRGVRGLRVVDASVFGSMPRSGGPAASTYMLAEYVSEILGKKYQWRFAPFKCQLGKNKSYVW